MTYIILIASKHATFLPAGKKYLFNKDEIERIVGRIEGRANEANGANAQDEFSITYQLHTTFIFDLTLYF